MEKHEKERVRAAIERIKKKLRITKLVATRSVKGKTGDNFMGMSATFWDSVQEDAGAGTDLVGAMCQLEAGQVGTSLDNPEVEVAQHVLSMNANAAALEHAVASGVISTEYFKDAMQAMQNNYNVLILNAIRKREDESQK